MQLTRPALLLLIIDLVLCVWLASVGVKAVIAWLFVALFIGVPLSTALDGRAKGETVLLGTAAAIGLACWFAIASTQQQALCEHAGTSGECEIGR